jgi:hypothetical protein
MSVEDFIIAVFCIIDDELAKTLDGKKLRKRGRAPGLIDSEIVLPSKSGTMDLRDTLSSTQSV